MRIVSNIRSTITEKTNQTELAHVFKAGSKIRFEDGYHHYFHPGSLEGVDQLSISGLRDAELHFLAPLKGKVAYTGPYRPDSAVLNLVNCQNVVIGNLQAENLHEFDASGRQESSVVNIENSSVKMMGSVLKSNGKLCLTVHSGSTVEIVNSLLSGYYFELFNAASSLTVKNSDIVQNHAEPDSHSMLWVSSRHRNATTTDAYDDGHTIIDRCNLLLETGRSLVCGNGSYDTRSNVGFSNCNLRNIDPTFGICPWHKNYNSISVATDFEDFNLSYIKTPLVGLAKFVDYYSEDQHSNRPGGQDEAAPIIIDGISSKDV
jgi:hypothetical protein